ncbi:MAG: tetratricopeptide repeat protein [Pseudomonadota bacterium]|nr:tetratricopeptide repeat protein [Pseudomonadota bacterium]
MDPIISEQVSADIIDVTLDNFMAEVIEASNTKGVIVQFWAPWCGPCKQLGPVLEKVVADHANLRLARVNIDENQEIAAQMRVQSVPTVYAIIEGRPVDGFAGAQPESTVRQFVEKILSAVPGAVDISPLIDAGLAALEAQDAEQALAAFQQALAAQPDSLAALSGLARALVLLGDLDSARDIIDNLEEDRRERPEMREALAAVQLAERAGETASEIQPLRDKLAADPSDLQAHQDLALALYASGETQEAMTLLLASIKQDNSWQDGAAKTQLFEFFNALGHAHPAVIAARRKLSAYLFS